MTASTPLASPSLDSIVDTLCPLITEREVPVELILLDAARGRILASPVVCAYPLPPRALAAVDGYAVRSRDVSSCRRLVSDESMDGLPKRIRRGRAAAVRASEVLPRGGDLVVPSARWRTGRGQIDALRTLETGANVIAPGSYVDSGEVLIEAGTSIKGRDLGILAAFGHERVPVFRRPTMGLMIVQDASAVAQPLPPWRDIAAIRHAAAGVLSSIGAHVLPLPPVPEDLLSVVDALLMALRHCDAVIGCGASQRGQELIASAIEHIKRDAVSVPGIWFHPGGTATLAVIDGHPILALPAEPTSALLALAAIAVPLTDAISKRRPEAQARPIVAAIDIAGRRGWETIIAVRVRDGRCVPLSHAAGPVFTLLRADGYLRIASEASRVPAGAMVLVHPFS